MPHTATGGCTLNKIIHRIEISPLMKYGKDSKYPNLKTFSKKPEWFRHHLAENH